MYILAKNQDKQQKLREEVRKIMPNKNTPLTEESLNNIPYMRACLKEVNRVRPIIQYNVRSTPSDIVLKGYQIPKDVIFINTHYKIIVFTIFFSVSIFCRPIL